MLLMSESLDPKALPKWAEEGEQSFRASSCARQGFNFFMFIQLFNSYNPMRRELLSLPFSGQKN